MRRAAAVLMFAALVLSGCAPAPAIDAATATALQDRVLAVTVAASTEDWATASTAIGELRVDVEAAAADGSLSDERHESLLAAIELVAADLEAAAAADIPTPTTEPEPTVTEEPASGNGNGKGNGNKPKKP